MLVAKLSISFLMQNIAVLKFGPLGTIATVLQSLNNPIYFGHVEVRAIAIVAIAVTLAALVGLRFLLHRTDIGLQMRAAAVDFHTARLLGLRANTVITAAVLLSGLLAATVSVVLTVQTPLVTPDYGLQTTIYVLVGVVVGGIDRLVSATLGGFLIGFLTGALGGFLPTQGNWPFTSSVYLDSAIYGLVVLVLLLRPSGLFAPARRTSLELVQGFFKSDLQQAEHTGLMQLLGPITVLAAFGSLAGLLSTPRIIDAENALIAVAIVVGLYVFIGNSGVFSFGQISFVALGAFAAGIMSIPSSIKATTLPGLFSVLRDHTIGNVESLVLAALVGALFALLVGIPLMRLSGLAAGIATFAVLGITYNILDNWTKIGPGPTTLDAIPETSDLWQTTVGAIAVVMVAFFYQRSRWGRQLRATRENAGVAAAAGVDIHRQRLWSFILSGSLCGFAGGLYIHFLANLTATEVYLNLTFLSLAMLVVGGVSSLWGAVIGALSISVLDSFLADSENGAFGFTLPSGTDLVAIGAVMLLILLVRPSGLTGGHEFRLPRRRLRRRVERQALAETPASEAQ
jgi:branched-chain amino acid transport system permease protein